MPDAWALNTPSPVTPTCASSVGVYYYVTSLLQEWFPTFSSKSRDDNYGEA
jgi:hypothetical protein